MVCGSKSGRGILRKQGYTIVQCKECHFAILKKYPKLGSLRSLYSHNYFKDKIEEDHLADSQHKYNLVSKYFRREKPRILDFGCGTGNFAKICKNRGNVIYGYDLSEYAASYIKKKYGIPAKSGKLHKEIYSKSYFDSICLFDVIEHMPNFRKATEIFCHWLKPGGYLILTTPNIESWDARLLGPRWYGFTKIPEHINYFSPTSIKMLLEENGFKIEKINTIGFARSIDFILGKLFKEKGLLQKMIKKIVDVFGVGKKIFYIPATDMIIIAKKVS